MPAPVAGHSWRRVSAVRHSLASVRPLYMCRSVRQAGCTGNKGRSSCIGATNRHGRVITHRFRRLPARIETLRFNDLAYEPVALGDGRF